MEEFDFTDALKIVLLSIFMLGSVQLHAVIDESGEHGPVSAVDANSPGKREVSDVPDPFDEAGAPGMQTAMPLRT